MPEKVCAGNKKPLPFLAEGACVLTKLLERVDQLRCQEDGVASRRCSGDCSKGSAVFSMIPTDFHAAQHIRPHRVLDCGRKFFARFASNTGEQSSLIVGFTTQVQAQLVRDLI